MRLQYNALWIAFCLASPTFAGATCSANTEERLQNFCKLNQVNNKVTPLAELQNLDFSLRREGFSSGLNLGLNEQLGRFSHRLSVSPLLYYSRNANGGVPKGKLELGGLALTPNESGIQKGAMLYGASLSYQSRLVYAERKYVDFEAYKALALTYDASLRVDSEGAAICSRNHADYWIFVDLCYRHGIERKSLLTNHSDALDLSVSKIFSINDSTFSKSSFSRINYWEAGYRQAQYAVKYDWLNSKGADFSLEYLFGDGVYQAQTLRRKVSLNASLEALGAPIGLNYSRQVFSGGFVFGYPRHDVVDLILMSIQLTPRIYPYMGMRRSLSNISYFSYREPIVGVRMSLAVF
jgi:hypothetical protein